MASKKNPTEPGLKSPQERSDVSSAGIKVIGEISKAALSALESAHPIFKVFIVVIVLAPIVSIAAGVVFLVRDHATYAFILFFVAIILPSLVFLVLLREIKFRMGQTNSAAGERFSVEAKPNVVSEWRRTVPKYPIHPTALDEMSPLLEHIRHSSFNCLHPMNASLQDRQIRANVFLADYSKAKDGIAFELFMPNDLRKNMNHPPEWLLRFNPGQGATGCVFVEGDQRVTRRLPNEEGQWESVFKMSDELKEKVHKDLKWIVSLPLKDRASQSTLAVLNIDGLDYDFTDEQLAEMVESVSNDIVGLATLMAGQPRVSLSTRVEEA